jgi:hypothetical protein
MIKKLALLVPQIRSIQTQRDELAQHVANFEADNQRLRTIVAEHEGIIAQQQAKIEKKEWAMDNRERQRRTIFIIGYARSGTTVLMDILNSSEEALVLSEFNYHIVRKYKNAFGWYGGDTFYEHFVSRKKTELPVLYKSAFLDIKPEENVHEADELLDYLARDYTFVGDKIALSFRDFDGVSELELLEQAISQNPEATYIYTFRRPDENLLSAAKMFPDSDLDTLARWIAGTWLVSLRAFARVNRSYLVFQDDVIPEIIQELEALFDLNCSLSEELVGRQMMKTRVQKPEDRDPVAHVKGMDEMTACYDELRSIFACDKSILKKSRTDALMLRVAGVISRLEPLVHGLVGSEMAAAE